MAAFESAYASLLQGVSQQIPRLRLPGQVMVQENMLSDTATGPRRRPGAEYQFSMGMVGENETSIKAWATDINGLQVHILVGTATGRWAVLSNDFASVLGTGTSAYLIAANINMLRATTVGSDFYMLNTSQKPTSSGVAPGVLTPTQRGFFYIRAGAYSKSYVVTVTTNLGTITLSHTTVTGANAGDAAKATPEFIANALLTSRTPAEWTAIGITLQQITESFCYIQAATTVTSVSVVSGSGSAYLTCSSNSKVRLESDLPQLLPASADGYIMAVGEQRSFRYYQYKSATTEWVESGIYDSPQYLQNMPVRFKLSGSVWSIEQPNYEGRVSGDDDNNPLPEFLTRGLTGMASYMNRMVLLSGSMVYMSSSTNALRFMRSTVSGLVDTDPISVGSSANSSAEYRYAVAFQKDLLLFSDKYQALIPSNGQAITPRSATVVVTSSYAGDMGTEPVPIGRTLLFPTPRSRDFFGFMEMISSQYSEAQYVSNDATAHLPKYMGGSCRFGVSSTTSNMVVFGSTGDRKALVVYEYLWDGEQKVQQAWHTWRFTYPVVYAYFNQGVVHLLFYKNGLLVCCTVDPKQGSLNSDAIRRPFIDLYVELDVVDGTGTVPLWMHQFDPEMGKVLTIGSGPQAGDELGIREYDPVTRQFVVKRGFTAGAVCLGTRFRQSFGPTQPQYMDQNGNKVDSVKMTVLKFGITTQNSSEYKVLVSDDLSESLIDVAQATLFFSSNELEPGRAMFAKESRATVPCRTDADTTALLMYTEGTGELNFIGIDYICRVNRKIRRR